METIDKNKKHNCENCIHKVVCALWEIQNELCDSECAYYQPTLTPQNEWVEALEAINNAAVAYIEGGPYENDLPGMEFAVEIDRLSRDFVRPPNEPLTFAELEKLDGQPVYIPKLHAWGLVNVSENTLYNYNGWAIKLYETSLMGVYRRPPEGEA